LKLRTRFTWEEERKKEVTYVDRAEKKGKGGEGSVGGGSHLFLRLKGGERKKGPAVVK